MIGFLNTKEIVRYVFSDIKSRKEILKIPYGCDDAKRKKIEPWIIIETLPKLLELREKKEVDRTECEHNYDFKNTGPSGKKTYPRCDLWWEKNSYRNFLEIKTFRFHRNSGLNPYKKRIIDDFKKEEYLRSPYNFHHLLIVFDDNHYNNGDWTEELYSLYNNHGFAKEDEWNIELDQRRTLHIFLHNRSIGCP